MKVLRSKIIFNQCRINNIFELRVDFSGNIIPGQFFMIKALDNSFLLPRPLSVNDVNGKEITFLYRAGGIGTTKISTMKAGDELQLFGPLGNGFDINKLHGRTAVVGGGIGIAPLLYLTKLLGKETDAYLGFKDITYGVCEFEKYAGNTIAVTENGSTGKKGFVTDYVEYGRYDAIVGCGPEIMMNKIIYECMKRNIRCYVSLERRMACGIGACLGCSVMTRNGIKRTCKDGPVFSGYELI